MSDLYDGLLTPPWQAPTKKQKERNDKIQVNDGSVYGIPIDSVISVMNNSQDSVLYSETTPNKAAAKKPSIKKRSTAISTPKADSVRREAQKSPFQPLIKK